MNRLLAIGFQFSGHWLLEEGRLQIDLERYAEQHNILYAFVCNGDVKYIGQSTKALRKRMDGYLRPAATSSTNIKNKQNISELLAAGAAVDIYVLPDNGMMHYGPYHLNLAAGLEASLITALKPAWNGHTKKRLQGTAVQERPAEEVTEYLPDTQPEAVEPDEPEGPVVKPAPVFTFNIRLENTYWEQGFFNGRKVSASWLGDDGDNIEILFGDEQEPILGSINRKVTGNDTPRVFGGPELRQRFQMFPRMTEMAVEVFSPTSIRIRPLVP